MSQVPSGGRALPTCHPFCRRPDLKLVQVPIPGLMYDHPIPYLVGRGDLLDALISRVVEIAALSGEQIRLQQGKG